MNVRMDSENSVLVFPVPLLSEIDCRPTTKSRDIFGANEKDN